MAQKGDFIGFTFNGIHSSELGIVRVSDGSRYNEVLLPNIEDAVVPVPGGDGSYYFGSYYRQRDFDISIAFDSLTESGLRKLKRHFGAKTMGDLIFDECPYKKYKVKVSSYPTLSYICFDEQETKKFESSITREELYGKNSNSTEQNELYDSNMVRIYKGEGNIRFTAYTPFARSVYKSLDKYDNINYTNKNEWKAASGMLENLNGYDDFRVTKFTKIYNPGDLETDFKLYFSFDGKPPSVDESETLLVIGKDGEPIFSVDENGILLITNEDDIITFFVEDETLIINNENNTSTSLSLKNIYLQIDNDSSTNQLKFDDNITRIIGDTGFVIDTKTNLIQGFKRDNGKEILTGTLYNNHITEGHFFKIPITTSEENKFHVVGDTIPDRIEYDYIYF